MDKEKVKAVIDATVQHCIDNGFTYDELNLLPDELRFRVSDILRGIQQQYVVSKNDVTVFR